MEENLNEEINCTRSLSNLNEEIFGVSNLKKMYLKRMIRDFSSVWWLLRHFKINEMINYLYTKAIVPGGEGSQRWIYNLGLDKFIQKYPDCVPI